MVIITINKVILRTDDYLIIAFPSKDFRIIIRASMSCSKCFWNQLQKLQ